jgi:glycosyltransferase involved in cell wall biosynthesis
MNVMISVIRPFHSVLLANTLARDRHAVTLYSAAPRKYFKGLAEDVRTRIVPVPLEIVSRLSGGRIPFNVMLHDATFFDKGVSLLMGALDAYIGWASLSLYSGIAAKRKGARYILDRACPHFDFQQDLIREESAKIGTAFTESPAWYRERVLREYEEADVILVPSEYTARSFQGHLKDKVVKAPLIGRCHIPETVHQKRNDVFTVGIVGGEPRRKGYLYLLRAWKKLALPNAKLLIRSSADFSQHPALDQLIKEMPNVEIVRYVPNISDFYQRCDAFVLSSVDDGFGMALFEAMINGVPCVVTRNCGASELLTDGEDALIIDARSDEQIAESLLRLYENEDERQSIAAKGRQTALHIANGAGARMYAEAVREMLVIEPPHAALPLSSRSA